MSLPLSILDQSPIRAGGTPRQALAESIELACAAERWGYLNRAFKPGQVGAYVEWLADRIASFPVDAVRLTKQAINSADKPLVEGLRDESYLFSQLVRTESGRANMRRFLEIGGQTRDGELRIQELNGRLGRPSK